MRARLIIAGVAVAASVVVRPVPASADPIVVSAAYQPVAPLGGYGFGGALDSSIAQSFVTGVAGSLAEIDLLLDWPQPQFGPGTLTLDLYRSSAGIPIGLPLTSQTISSSGVPIATIGGSWVPFTSLAALALPIDQQFAIALSGTTNFDWWGASNNPPLPSPYPLGTIAQQFYNADGSVSRAWYVNPEQNGDLGFRVLVDLGTGSGSQPPSPTPEPATFLLVATGIVAAARKIRDRRETQP